MRRGLISFLVIVVSLAGKAKDRPEPPHACVSANGLSLCLSGLRWIMYGNSSNLQRISGVFENNTTEPIRAVRLTFSLFDANDSVVESATATMDATIPPGGKSVFNAPFEEPVGTGIRRVTLYTKQVRMEVVGTSQAATDLQIPVLFTTGNLLGVRKYKKLHGLP